MSAGATAEGDTDTDTSLPNDKAASGSSNGGRLSNSEDGGLIAFIVGAGGGTNRSRLSRLPDLRSRTRVSGMSLADAVQHPDERDLAQRDFGLRPNECVLPPEVMQAAGLDMTSSKS